jgi:two-component system response regulator ChvI
MSQRSGRTVAIVEDEDGIRESVVFALEREGHAAIAHADGRRAWTAFDAALPDLVILDIGLPGMDGLELCRRLRGRSEALPIVFLTSREEEFDRVLGLEIGADDYLCKPFSMRELMARVKALLRRALLTPGPGPGSGIGSEPGSGLEPGLSSGPSSGLDAGGTAEAANVRVVGPLWLDADRYAMAWRGTAVRLTVTEFLLLEALVRRPGHVRTRDQLLQAAYPHDTDASDRTIDSHVKRLRRKFQEVDAAFDAIESVYGAGYRFRDGVR